MQKHSFSDISLSACNHCGTRANMLNWDTTFGSPLIGRTYQAESLVKYRFGFNGKELDKEGMGGGQSTYDYGFRIFNPGLGRFLSIDPLFKSYPWYTPYQFSGNKPIHCIDLDGLEEYNVVSWYNADRNVWQTKLSLVKIDGPLTVNYSTRTWDDGIVPVNSSLIATSGYTDTKQGTSTATNPWKTKKEAEHATRLLAANKPPNGILGDNNYDKEQFIEDSDPTVIPVPPVTPPIATPPAKAPTAVEPQKIKSTIDFIGSQNKFASQTDATKEIKKVAADYLKNGVGIMTVKGNVYAPGQKMEDDADLNSQAQGYKTLGDLAKARALAIKNELVKQGVPSEKIKIELGKTDSRTADYTYKKKG